MYDNILQVLKNLGYKESKTETLRNKEFKEVSRNLYINSSYSTYECLAFVEEYNLTLLLNKKDFSNDKVKEIISDINKLGVASIEARIDNEENEMIILFSIVLQ